MFRACHLCEAHCGVAIEVDREQSRILSVRGDDRDPFSLGYLCPKARLGLRDGGRARVFSRAGALEAPVVVTDELMPGVVSLPHGYGHGAPGSRMQVASAHAGVNSNRLTDELAIEALSGNAILNGIPVEVSPV